MYTGQRPWAGMRHAQIVHTICGLNQQLDFPYGTPARFEVSQLHSRPSMTCMHSLRVFDPGSSAEMAVIDAAQCCCKCIGVQNKSWACCCKCTGVQKQVVGTELVCGNIFHCWAAACNRLAIMTAPSKQVDELCRNWGWHACIQIQMSGPASRKLLQPWMNSPSWRLKTLWK